MRQPLIAFYSRTYLARSENFLYHQMRGVTKARTHVVALSACHLDEFPPQSAHFVLPPRWSLGWIVDHLARRAASDSGSRFALSARHAEALAQHLDEISPDLVYCLFGWNAAQLVDVLARASRPVPLVWHAAGSDITAAASLGATYVERLREAVEYADGVLCGSRFLRDRLMDLGVSDDKAILHYIGVDVPEPPQHSNRGQRYRILAVSRLVPVKGTTLTIRAFARVASEMPEATLEIIGDGPELATCKGIAHELGVSDRVTFRGELSARHVDEAMWNADIFVQHNVRSSQGQEEGLGGTLIEASARSLPVVSTTSGGIPEAVVDGNTGILVTPGDVDGMAEAISLLHGDPALRERLGEAGRRHIQTHFDRTAQNRKLEDRLLGAARATPCAAISSTSALKSEAMAGNLSVHDRR